jgi:uncharacterized protein YqgQ
MKRRKKEMQFIQMAVNNLIEKVICQKHQMHKNTLIENQKIFRRNRRRNKWKEKNVRKIARSLISE